MAPVAGTLIGEGAHHVWFVGVDDLWRAGVVEMTLGAALTTACAWRDRRPILVLGAVAAAVAVHRPALSVLDAGFSIPI